MRQLAGMSRLAMAAEAAVADVGPPLGAEETQTATLGLTGGGART